MATTNLTVTDFVLLGFYEHPRLQFLLSFVFLVLYVTTVGGNMLTISLICLDQHLRSPMYIFLCNMSILDVSFTTMVLPKLLDVCLTNNHIISYTGCIIQVYCFVLLIVTEYFILASMAYDRYVAICHPLRYPYLMSLRVCITLVWISWLVGVLEGLLFVVLISSFKYCRSNQINHLFCDLKPLIKLSCSSTLTIETVILGIGSFVGLVPSAMTVGSYISIISIILKIQTKIGRQKAFSTCSSHLTVIILFYGMVLGMYMRPKSSYAIDQDKILAVLYAGVIPMINPLIYSLKNEEVRGAISRIRDKIMKIKL